MGVAEAAVDFPSRFHPHGSVWSLARPCSGGFRPPVFSLLSQAADQSLQNLLVIFPVE
jgi:hypothetical protein